ncbi:MAG: hypothetical protein K6C94_04770 [Candidatus Gastranaerophilales bacterium]|nr:hypothetical protein [Candidatus Gastranaerophilales bacterium]
MAESYELYQYKKQFEAVADKDDSVNWKMGYKILKDYPINEFNPSAIKKTNKSPVLWFGCSFADGDLMPIDKKPYNKLSDLTGRTVINRAQGGTGTQYIYNQFINFDFKKIAPDVDFIIYTYIDDHLHRLYTYQINPLTDIANIRYEYKNNKLQKIPRWNKYLYSSFLIKRLKNICIHHQWNQEYIDYHLFNITINECRKKMKELYPDAKFILIEFNTKDQIKEDDFIPPWEIKKLKSYGIDVIKLRDYTGNTDITDDKYWFEDKINPREELWDIILPVLVKKYNM